MGFEASRQGAAVAISKGGERVRLRFSLQFSQWLESETPLKRA